MARMDMQCQACHGNMSMVGSPDRVGWFMEPNCQSCHTGTATSNNGQIRYSSAFEANGTPRVAVNATFATTPNTPAAGPFALPFLLRARRIAVLRLPRLDARRVSQHASQ